MASVPEIPAGEVKIHSKSAQKVAPDIESSSLHDVDRVSVDVRNMWYPIAIAADIKRDEPVGFSILGDPIVLFRDKSGRAAVLADYCAHRSAPLSIGMILGGELTCRYHGWKYDANGAVTHIPALLPDKKIPSNAKVRCYPSHEKDDLLWVWPGDAEKADLATIPNMKPGGDEPGWGKGTLFSLDFDIDHSLMIENLLDPAHIYWAHNGSIGNWEQAGPIHMHLVPYENGFAGYKTDGTPEDEAKGGASSGKPEFIFTAPCHIQLKFHLRKNWFLDQTFHCVPVRRGVMRLIYHENRTFFTFQYYIPILARRIARFSIKIFFQDYEILRGQMNRLRQGAREWASPIQVDVLPKLYRSWWRKSFGVRGAKDPWFKGFSGDLEDLTAPDSAYCGGCNISSDLEPMYKENPYADLDDSHPERRMKKRAEMTRKVVLGGVMLAASVGVISIVLARNGVLTRLKN